VPFWYPFSIYFNIYKLYNFFYPKTVYSSNRADNLQQLIFNSSQLNKEELYFYSVTSTNCIKEGLHQNLWVNTNLINHEEHDGHEEVHLRQALGYGWLKNKL